MAPQGRATQQSRDTRKTNTDFNWIYYGWSGNDCSYYASPRDCGYCMWSHESVSQAYETYAYVKGEVCIDLNLEFLWWIFCVCVH